MPDIYMQVVEAMNRFYNSHNCDAKYLILDKNTKDELKEELKNTRALKDLNDGSELEGLEIHGIKVITTTDYDHIIEVVG